MSALVPELLEHAQSQLLFTLLAHRYTRGALIITSNLEFADWTSVFAGDERLTSGLRPSASTARWSGLTGSTAGSSTECSMAW
jgi:DNA replication protein DnaC